ncbi:MAG: plasmid recombination protein [Leptospirillum sp.]
MAGIVSVRVWGTQSAIGELGHDARTSKKIPKNVDQTRTHLNRVLIGSMTQEDLEKSKREQTERIRSFTKKAPRRDANYYIPGIITFSKEARNQVNSMPPDGQAMKFVEDVSKKNDVKIIYLVRHSDESTTHYHFLLEYVDSDGRAVGRKLNKKALSGLQDEAGMIFGSIGLTRGIKKTERLARGEDFAKTVHRSVRQLHEDLPGEIAIKKSQLDQIQEKVASFSTQVPEPKAVPVEIVKERHLFRIETAKARVINFDDFERYKKSVAGRIAVTDTILSGDVVPGEEFREVSHDLSMTRADLAQTNVDLSNARQELITTRGELQEAKEKIGVLRVIIDWVQDHFPVVLERFLDEQQEDDAKESPSPPSGGPRG